MRARTWLLVVFSTSLALTLLAACGARESGDSLGGAPTRVSLAPSAAPFTAAAASAAIPGASLAQAATPAAPTAVATATPRVVIGMSGSVEGMPDLAHLTWTANAIVRGRVIATLPSQQYPTDQGYADNQIYTDYIVQVIATFRGPAQTSVTVRRYGGTVGDTSLVNTAEPELRVGDEAVVFLAASTSQSDTSLWLNGGAQGWWPTAGEQLVSAPYGVAAVADLARSIADILAQPPPADLTLANGTVRYVPLDAAPPGVDLPPAPTANKDGQVLRTARWNTSAVTTAQDWGNGR